MSLQPLIDMVVALLLLVNVSETANGNVRQAAWSIVLGASSASLGQQGALLVTSSTVLWPDGKQDLVTFWETNDAIYRCIDHVRSNETFTAGPCFAPR